MDVTTLPANEKFHMHRRRGRAVGTNGCQVRLVLQARGLEADSNKLGLEIHYDGKWHDDNEYMRRHMVITEFVPEKGSK